MNTRSNKNLFLFTAEFPNGRSESNFLSAEIEFLANRFSKVYLIPFKTQKENIGIPLPSNVTVLDFNSNILTEKDRIKHFVTAFQILVTEIVSRNGLKILKNFRYHLSQSVNYSCIADKLYARLTKLNYSQEDILYTYWFDEWTSVLCILKKKLLLKNNLITRAHGFDLYDYRNQLNYIFPRYFQFKYVNMVYSISMNGQNYLRKNYPIYENKVGYSPLGTIQKNSDITTTKQTKLIRLVSCSSVIELKRVEKIVGILEKSTKNIEWIHFGDGPLLKDIKVLSYLLPKNVTAIFMGEVDNSKIIEFYRENYVDFFINVSMYEGVPVSIMEAISFGIPVIATDVGGVSEIVKHSIGSLFPIEFDSTTVCNLIESREYSKTERESIFAFWKENFSAEKNYEKFCNNLISTY